MLWSLSHKHNEGVVFNNPGGILFLLIVGKLRKKWLRKTIGDVGLGSMRAVKQFIDPQNIFGCNNLMMGEPEDDHGVQDQRLTSVLQSKL